MLHDLIVTPLQQVIATIETGAVLWVGAYVVKPYLEKHNVWPFSRHGPARVAEYPRAHKKRRRYRRRPV